MHAEAGGTALTFAVPAHQHEVMTTNPWSHFIRHYLEMVAAMIAGMAILWGLGEGIAAIIGVELSLPPEVAALKMVAAMFVPAIVLLPLSRLGVISADAVMLATHILMLPLMFVVMLRRRAEYA
jgi:flagellar biosynthetic protein FliP